MSKISASTKGAAGGATINPATTVVSETSASQTPAVGISTNYAREDHTHGTPAAGAITAFNNVILVPYGSQVADITISNGSVTATSKIIMSNGNYANSDENSSEDRFYCSILSRAAGSFVLRISSEINDRVGGSYNFNYLLG